MVHFVRRVTVAALAVVLVSGLAHASAAPGPAQGPTSADSAVTALVEDALTVDHLPPGFTEVMGYTPVAAPSGRLVRPDGECSSPVGRAHKTFLDACRSHDLGYDLLRYAGRTGQALSRWARFEIDRRFGVDLLRSCSTWSCHLVAVVFTAAVSLNSVRQGFGVPVPEPVLPWLAILAAVTVAAAWQGGAQAGVRSPN